MKNHIFLSITIFQVFFLIECSPPPKTVSYVVDQEKLNSSFLHALYIPIDTISSQYIDKTVMKQPIEFSDSFYLEAVNELITFQISKRFKLITLDSLTRPFQMWSKVNGDTTSVKPVAQKIRDLASSYKADLIVIPYSCKIFHKSVQQDGWREGKYGGSYERPISYSANADLHLQVWDKTGKLIYERIGKGVSGQPLFYSMFKHKSKGKFVGYARKIFAPPLLRALNKAVNDAVSFQ